MRFSYRRVARPVLLAALIVAGTCLPASFRSAKAATAPNYTARSEGYSIWLPGKPKAGSRDTLGFSGARMKVHFISVSQPPLSYVVLPIRLPGAPKGAEIDQFLGGVQRGFTKSPRAKLLSSKNLNANGHRGREVLVKVGANLMRARFFVADNRSFQIIAISPQNGAGKYQAQITKVLESFRILP